MKPNKFHSKYVCFGGQKTRKEREICLKIHLFGIPETLVMRSTCKVVSLSTLIGPFKIWACTQIQQLLALKFKQTSQSWEWNHLARSHCRGPHHMPLRIAEEANFKSNFSFFTSLSTDEAHVFRWNLLGFMELLVLLRFRTFLFEEKAICGVTSGQRWMEWFPC